jgi:tryptophan synthase alpha chain
MVKRVRLHSNVPIVLMGYYNPIFHYGPERFAEEAGAAGVDGLLLVDLPPEEAEELHPHLRDNGIAPITLLAPTTGEERTRQLAASGEGFLYYVSMTGVTGTAQVDADAIEASVTALKQQSRVPVAVGFGVSTPSDAKAIGRFADGVVVGSALVKLIATHGQSDELLAEVKRFAGSLKEALLSSGE